MPKIQFRSNAKPSTYAYPEPLQPPKKEEKEKVPYLPFFSSLIFNLKTSTTQYCMTSCAPFCKKIFHEGIKSQNC